MFIESVIPNYMEASTAVGEAAPKKELGRDDFLTLLVAQLKHQDPLNPLEGTDFSAQLAQFSSLEQLFGVNDTLTGIQESLDVREDSNVLDYIGKVVKTKDNTVLMEEGRDATVAYTLKDRANVTISIYDDQGLEVRSIYAGWKDAGEHENIWDGRNNNGEMVGEGSYTFELEARDEDGYMVSYDTYLTGEVVGVTYQNGVPFLMIGNRAVTPDNILEVKKIANNQIGGE